jgi:hypothetical protein
MTKPEKPEKKDKKPKEKKPKRFERRFVARSAANPWLVRGLAGAAGLLGGAGLYGYFYAGTYAKDVVATFYESQHLQNLPAYMIAVAALLLGAAIWLGTSSEHPVRVGDPGIAIEKGETRRLPWWGIKAIVFESGSLALVVTGKDEAGATVTLRLPLKSHPDAIGWILKEADERIPKKLDISDSVFEKLPRANEHAGMRLALEPLQVVGKRCAVTGKIISYEPDAQVCTRCERVYLKKSAPKKCKCGAMLGEKTAGATDEPDTAEAPDEVDESESEDEHEHEHEGEDEDEDEDEDEKAHEKAES